MDDIIKFLKKRTAEERKRLFEAMALVKQKGRLTPKSVALKGMPGWYRIRSGTFRVIFMDINDEVTIKKLSRRSEKTYKRI